MGNLNAAAMAEAVGEGQVGLRPALHWHLTANHYPPVPASMVDVCVAAIEAVCDGEDDSEVELPEEVSYRGLSTAPASAIVENYHLGFFVENAMVMNEADEYDPERDDFDDETDTPDDYEGDRYLS
jgi:hypothetical protein